MELSRYLPKLFINFFQGNSNSPIYTSCFVSISLAYIFRPGQEIVKKMTGNRQPVKFSLKIVMEIE
jgi:hypothetical protein